MDKIIINYLMGEISLEEQHKLRKWLDEDKSHPVILDQMKKYLAQGELNFPQQKKVVYNRLLTEIRKVENPTPQKKVIGFRVLLRYAAVVFVASAISVAIYSTFEKDQYRPVEVLKYIEKVSLPGQKVTTVLPDGTTVKLNVDSKIIVPEVFAGGKREVTLVGEAFFDVTPDPRKPFIVHFGGNEVRVLGTSFNIRAYQQESAFVAVKTGKVLVTQGQEEVKLLPNEATNLNGSQLKVIDFTNNNAFFGWTENKLIINKASINQALIIISKWYGMKYELRAKIEDDKLYTASHNNPTLKEVMEVLTYTYNVNYEIEDETIVIK
jgi:transmembrane sensor